MRNNNGIKYVLNKEDLNRILPSKVDLFKASYPSGSLPVFVSIHAERDITINLSIPDYNIETIISTNLSTIKGILLWAYSNRCLFTEAPEMVNLLSDPLFDICNRLENLNIFAFVPERKYYSSTPGFIFSDCKIVGVFEKMSFVITNNYNVNLILTYVVPSKDYIFNSKLPNTKIICPYNNKFLIFDNAINISKLIDNDNSIFYKFNINVKKLELKDTIDVSIPKLSYSLPPVIPGHFGDIITANDFVDFLNERKEIVGDKKQRHISCLNNWFSEILKESGI